MIRKTALSILSVAVLMIADATVMNVAQAFDMGNMMNPSRWFDNDHDRYDRGYYRGYGPYGGYGYGPWGYGGGPYGYGGPWGGYPGYGGWGGGYPGYGQGPSTIVVNPTPENARQAPPPAPRLPE